MCKEKEKKMGVNERIEEIRCHDLAFNSENRVSLS